MQQAVVRFDKLCPCDDSDELSILNRILYEIYLLPIDGWKNCIEVYGVMQEK